MYVGQIFFILVFLFKVYAILLAQLLFTTGIICINLFVPQLQAFNRQYYWISFICFGVSLLLWIMLYCCMRVFPLNLILLTIWTAVFAWPIGMLCSFYTAYSVLITLGVTTFVVVCCNWLTCHICCRLCSPLWFALLEPIFHGADWDYSLHYLYLPWY